MEDKNVTPKRTRKNILIFLFFLLVLVFVPRILMYHKSDVITIKSEFTSTQTFYKTQKKKFRNTAKFHSNRRKKEYKAPKSRFDPNTYSLSQWMDLGLTEKQAIVVLKFTKYGINSIEKLKKIFVIPPELFALIKDSVFFPEKTKTVVYDSGYNRYEKRSSPVPIEINSSTQENLQKIRGIGLFYARQIIRYRGNLGGFYSVNQIMEVWKMNDSIYQKMLPFIYVDETLIKRININSSDANELKKHPYIDWNLANSIIKIRNQQGNYTNIEQVKKSKLITDEIFEKIKPYLTL